MASPLHGYTETEYKNAPDHKTTPLNASNLNHGEGGIKDAHTDIKYIYDEIGDIVAPHQESLVADKNYAIGDQFIYEGKLYKATAAISSGGTITIGTNCVLADSVTEQISEVNAKIDKGSVSVTADGVKTWGTLLNELFLLIDFTKVSEKTKLYRNDDNFYFDISRIESNNTIHFGSTMNYGTNMRLMAFELYTTDSKFIRCDMSSSGNTMSNGSSSVPTAGTYIKIYY